LGYAKLGETLLKFFEKKKYHEFSKYIAGKFWDCYRNCMKLKVWEAIMSAIESNWKHMN